MKTRIQELHFFTNAKPFLLFISKDENGKWAPGLESFLASFENLDAAKEDFERWPYKQAHVLCIETLKAWEFSK